ncbi:hypothetical protein ANOM_009272 [Aspergillus nomiae NRRL 13137]|uniref:Uncharacterized protein n=1 Tax=Aspergillus nomiae NRRL (strain ATCC 15546 / NRRL 13137 / CBS 260.88 / M93) TaxID=1509407 RepID=A0A0L1ISW5_ASPN3|nr:uncharacterized protein ANOM_009272 [Aspergillus nomiae NRRL 13137]KNG82460.1 hypothetical protein ANOM_009272 [Aspergillus nomiae NRRL 13137]
MRVYTGKINYGSYAQDEIINVIFGEDCETMNEPVTATWQWTRNAAGERKANSIHVGTLNGLKHRNEGETEIEFLQNQALDSYYWFQGRVTESDLVLTMYNERDEFCVDNITLERTS